MAKGAVPSSMQISSVVLDKDLRPCIKNEVAYVCILPRAFVAAPQNFYTDSCASAPVFQAASSLATGADYFRMHCCNKLQVSELRACRHRSCSSAIPCSPPSASTRRELSRSRATRRQHKVKTALLPRAGQQNTLPTSPGRRKGHLCTPPAQPFAPNATLSYDTATSASRSTFDASTAAKL